MTAAQITANEIPEGALGVTIQTKDHYVAFLIEESVLLDPSRWAEYAKRAHYSLTHVAAPVSS